MGALVPEAAVEVVLDGAALDGAVPDGAVPDGAVLDGAVLVRELAVLVPLAQALRRVERALLRNAVASVRDVDRARVCPRRVPAEWAKARPGEAPLHPLAAWAPSAGWAERGWSGQQATA